ncbi:MAG: ribonuclease Z [Bradymonadia bacterium]|jgi:ribonuclease Z
MFLQYGGDAVLFDCGECAQIQIQKTSGKTSRLVAIALSHFHGDHVNGLPGFIGTMGLNGHEAPLALIGPVGINRWLRALHEVQILRPSFPLNIVENDENELFRGDGFGITGVRLRHRIPTHGFIFREDDLPGRFDLKRAAAVGVPPGPLFGELQAGKAVTLEDGRVVEPAEVLGPARKGRSIAYMCDTRPSDAVVEAVRGVDILVHEATYMHELAQQARERGHSTTRQAAEIAQRAGVGQLILTHISPKHTRRKPILAEAREVFSNVALAEDLAEFSVPIPG